VLKHLSLKCLEYTQVVWRGRPPGWIEPPRENPTPHIDVDSNARTVHEEGRLLWLRKRLECQTSVASIA